MLPPGAAEGNRQVTFSLVDVVRQKIDQQLGDAFDKLRRLREGANILRNFRMTSREWAKFRHKMWVGKKAHIEHQIGVVGNAVPEAEADAGNQNIPALLFFLKQPNDVGTQFVDVEL